MGICMKTGLVLEGGGMRGIYTAGILDVFLEHNIQFDGVIGVSAGALHGCSFVSKQKGRSIRYYKKYCADSRFMSVRNWIFTGDFVGAEFCYHQLPEELDLFDFEAFKNSPTKFYATVTNLETGKAEHHLITDMKEQVDYMRASASLPIFSKIVELDGKKYLDGGCANSIPLKDFQEMGYERNVLILTREPGYKKKAENTKLTAFLYRKYPKFVAAMNDRPRRYNAKIREIRQMEKDGKVLVIQPQAPLEIGRLENNPEKIQEIYNLGCEDGLKYVEAVKEYLADKNHE